MQLKLSDKAVAAIADILLFVSEQHNADLADRLECAIADKLGYIERWPYSCPQVDTRAHGSVRKAIVNQLTILFYVVEDTITVVDAVDARSDW